MAYPPGKRQVATLGERISESPYRRYWGSVRGACEALAAFHDGKISREKLLAGNTEQPARVAIPLKDKWAVLKRDDYRCTRCGASPARDHQVELEVDHIVPVARGGGNSTKSSDPLPKLQPGQERPMMRFNLPALDRLVVSGFNNMHYRFASPLPSAPVERASGLPRRHSCGRLALDAGKKAGMAGVDAHSTARWIIANLLAADH